MERYDDTAPVYFVNDHTLNHADYETSDSDDTMFSETSSMRTMSTLQSDQVAGTFPVVSRITYHFGVPLSIRLLPCRTHFVFESY